MTNLNVPMYDPRLVQPMREELTRIGFQELRTPVDARAPGLLHAALTPTAANPPAPLATVPGVRIFGVGFTASAGLMSMN